MADMNSLFTAPPAQLLDLLKQPQETSDLPTDEADADEPTITDEEILDLWKDIKREAFANRWVFERQIQRNLLYVLGRQWIEYFPNGGGWRDKRLPAWVPKPVTNKCRTTVDSIRSMFASIKLGLNARPQGSNPENVAAAAIADELTPVLWEAHDMDQVMSEFDFWFIVGGCSVLHSFVEYDLKYGSVEETLEQCADCQQMVPTSALANALSPKCPKCGGSNIGPAMDDQGQPMKQQVPNGQPVTIPLSPFEFAFNMSTPRWSDLPYVVRMRFRPKSYFANDPDLKTLVDEIKWQKAPSDQSLQIFRALAVQNDMGINPQYSEGLSGSNDEEGIPEFEVWMKPTDKYPEGLIFRVVGDASPKVIRLEHREGLPGPLPFKDARGLPLFPFFFAPYGSIGGRIMGSGPIDLIWQKQDQINQADSMFLLIINRVGNPVWLEPKGSEVERLTGMPGLIVRYNSLTGGGAKPERIGAEGPHASLFQLREQYVNDIEELAGTFDIIKGAKPTGVEAFSALQLLVERSQARFALPMSSRGHAVRAWYGCALELERSYGPPERIKAIQTPARSWTFKSFQKADLTGSLDIIIEDGSNAPKTSLGMRAALEHANQLGMLDMKDPDQRYEGLKLMGLTRLAPTLDIHVQRALQKQDTFESWLQAEPAAAQQTVQAFQTAIGQWEVEAAQPGGFDSMTGEPAMPLPSLLAGTPLQWRSWYEPSIHRQEFLKWANGDRVQELMQTSPEVVALLDAHLKDIEQAQLAWAQHLAAQQAAATTPPAGPVGAGSAMAGSNREAGAINVPKGTGQGAQNQGPA